MRTLTRYLRRLGRLCLGALWLALTLTLVWPLLAHALDNTLAPRAPTPGGSDFLVVAPQALRASAEAWATYRATRGYRVRVETFVPEGIRAEDVRGIVQRVYRESGRPYPFYVLLLGQAHPEVDGLASHLPAGRVPLDLPPATLELVGFDDIASDDAYALDDDGVLLPIALGRVPARTDAEARAVLARTQAYEARPPQGEGRVRIELFASESLYGPEFDALIEKLVIFFVEAHLPAQYRWHMLYGRPGSPYSYPAEAVPDEVARRLNAGALLATYIGHGSRDYLGPALNADGWEGPVFTAENVPAAGQAQASLVVMIACSAGEYDRGPSLAEQLLLQPGGPVATYAASRLTLPAANTILGKDLWRVLLTGKATTAGEWVRQAEGAYRNPGADEALSLWALTRAVPPLYTLAIQGAPEETPALDAELVYGLQQHAYNLFGDPALALAVARPALRVAPDFPWQAMGTSLTVRGQGALLAAGQSVTVTLYTRQGVLLPRAVAAPDLAAQYVQANDKVVARVVVTADAQGAFVATVPVAADLPSGHYLVEALAVTGNATLVGVASVYTGWPPVGEWVGAAWFWWGVISGCALWTVRRRPQRASD